MRNLAHASSIARANRANCDSTILTQSNAFGSGRDVNAMVGLVAEPGVQ